MCDALQVLDHLIEYVAWPSTLEQATRDNRFRTDSAGNVQLFSGDGCACVELACHGQTLTSAYLARVAGEETEHHVAVEGSEAAETSVVNLEEEKVRMKQRLRVWEDPNHGSKYIYAYNLSPRFRVKAWCLFMYTPCVGVLSLCVEKDSTQCY